MTRRLLVVAASGLVLAILLLSAAWAIGGSQMLAYIHSGHWHFGDDDDDDNKGGARMTHSLAFDPKAAMTVDAPVDIHFVRGETVSMTVSGSPGMVNAVQWQGNHLTMKDGPTISHHMLKLEIVAPQMPPLTFGGAGEVSLEKLDQDALQIDLSGAGTVDASGRVQTVAATISGAGNVDLGELNATDATVTASGIGNLDLKASGKVAVILSGAGNVTLHQKPAQLTSQITGVGSVDHDY